LSAGLAIFALVAAVVIAGGLGVVTSRNVAHAAIFLLLALGAIAGIFVLLLAEFLALVQILIYGGAVVIVLLFALMLTRREEFSQVRDNPQRPLAVVAAVILMAVISAGLIGSRVETQALERPSIEAIGTELFSQWAISFEVASLVLLVALVGAIIIARETGR
jgi:NADH-quinone oxidoreductase subunit J